MATPCCAAWRARAWASCSTASTSSAAAAGAWIRRPPTSSPRPSTASPSSRGRRACSMARATPPASCSSSASPTRYAEPGASAYASLLAGSFGRNDEVADARAGTPRFQARGVATRSHSDDYADGRRTARAFALHALERQRGPRLDAGRTHAPRAHRRHERRRGGVRGPRDGRHEVQAHQRRASLAEGGAHAARGKRGSARVLQLRGPRDGQLQPASLPADGDDAGPVGQQPRSRHPRRNGPRGPQAERRQPRDARRRLAVQRPHRALHLEPVDDALRVEAAHGRRELLQSRDLRRVDRTSTPGPGAS